MPAVKHTIIRWAREKAGFSIEEAAHKLYIKDDKRKSAIQKLSSIEKGERPPSRSLLVRMSKAYRQSLLTFYLDKPPLIGDRGEDFRTLPDIYEGQENLYVDVLIRNIRAKQRIIKEMLIDEDESNELDFVGKHQIEDGVNTIAEAIRNILNIRITEYRSKANNREAFKFMRRKAESIGIFVILKGNLGSYHSDIDAEFFRGYVLADRIAPFIVINDHDAESAWAFTLIHEMAHLLLGDTGTSGAYAEQQKEKFCNNVASEFLLPKKEFIEFKFPIDDFESLKIEVSYFAKSRKISSTHVAYRLLRRGDIDMKTWEKLNKYYHLEWLRSQRIIKNKFKEKDSGPNRNIVDRYKLGSLVELVQRYTYSGALTTSKAGLLLDKKPLKVHMLFQPL